MADRRLNPQSMEQQSPFGDPVYTPPPSVSEDVASFGLRAARTGVELIPAGPGELSGLVPKLVRAIIQKRIDLGLGSPQELVDFDKAYAQNTPGNIVPDLSTVRKYITDPILGHGEDVPAQTPAGGFVKTGLEMGPSSILNPGSIYSKTAQWLGGTVGSEGAGQIAEAAGAPPWAQQTARFVGGGVGALAPQGFNRTFNPRPIPSFRQPHIDFLKARNVPLSAGQVTGNKRLMMKEDVAGGTPAHEQQGDAYTQAAMREQSGFPAGTPRTTGPVMKMELSRMGAEFDRIESISAAPFSQQLQNDLLDTVQTYIDENPHVAPVVENTMNDLAKNAANNNGVLTGEAYKSIRTRINKLIGQESTEPGVIGALMDMKDKLDDAIQQNLPATEQHAWRTVRAQYRNYLPIERARSAQGQQAAEGTINPKQLKMGVKAIEGRREIASGDRPMTKLAEAGEVVLEKPQSSGTAERQQAQRGGGVLPLMTGGGTVGALLSAGLPPALATAIGAGTGIASAVIPAARDAFIRSDVGQRFLQRQGPRIATGNNPTLQVLRQMMAEAAQQQDALSNLRDRSDQRLR